MSDIKERLREFADFPPIAFKALNLRVLAIDDCRDALADIERLEAELAAETEARLANDKALNAFMKKMVRCENCEGSGLINNHITGEVECSTCDGTGWSSALVLELAETMDELTDAKRELAAWQRPCEDVEKEIAGNGDCNNGGLARRLAAQLRSAQEESATKCALIDERDRAIRGMREELAAKSGGAASGAGYSDTDIKAMSSPEQAAPPAPGGGGYAQPCCGEFAICERACTPRGRWQVEREQYLTSPANNKLAAKSAALEQPAPERASVPKEPMPGIWILTAPDGREWSADHPLKCCALERNERVPARIQLDRIQKELSAEMEARNFLEGDRAELQAKIGHLEQQLAAAPPASVTEAEEARKKAIEECAKVLGQLDHWESNRGGDKVVQACVAAIRALQSGGKG